jgi:hypothetical protein
MGDQHGERSGLKAPDAGDAMIDFVDLWVYLAGEPLLWLTVTLVAYVIADWISLYFNRHPAANPVLISVAIVSVCWSRPARPSPPISPARSSFISCSARRLSRSRCRSRAICPT